MNEITDDPMLRATNPLLQRARFPGETFALPSGGLLYKNGELAEDVKKGEVLVFPMVTLDEITMKTPDKLLNGTAIAEVFRRCIPQVLKPLDLFGKDIDYLMICLRKVTYGNEIEVTAKHDCKESEEHSYVIDINEPFRKAKKLSQRTIKTYSMTLPNGQVVNMVPPKYHEVMKFYQSMNQSIDETNDAGQQIADSVFQTLSNLISSVDNTEKKEFIYDWLKQLSAGYVNRISDMIPVVTNWGVDLNVKLECKDCKKKFDFYVNLNPIDFFS
jgi:hypothetical protein